MSARRGPLPGFALALLLLARPTPAREPPETREVESALERVLSLPEFQPKKPSWLEELWSWIKEKVGEALRGVLGPVSESLARPEAARWVIVALAVLLLLLLAHMIWTVLSYREAEAPRGPAAAAAPVPGLDPRPCFEAARELAAAGRHLEAMRVLYFGVILSLDVAGRARYRESKTGGEYARELIGSPVEAPFRSLVKAFYAVAYGARPAAAEAYERMRERAAEMGVLR